MVHNKFSLSSFRMTKTYYLFMLRILKVLFFGFVTLLKKIYKIPNITMTDKMPLSIYQMWACFRCRCYCLGYLAKAGTCARDRHAIQQLALNVHAKHSDLTWPDLIIYQGSWIIP